MNVLELLSRFASAAPVGSWPRAATASCLLPGVTTFDFAPTPGPVQLAGGPSPRQRVDGVADFWLARGRQRDRPRGGCPSRWPRIARRAVGSVLSNRPAPADRSLQLHRGGCRGYHLRELRRCTAAGAAWWVASTRVGAGLGRLHVERPKWHLHGVAPASATGPRRRSSRPRSLLVRRARRSEICPGRLLLPSSARARNIARRLLRFVFFFLLRSLIRSARPGRGGPAGARARRLARRSSEVAIGLLYAVGLRSTSSVPERSPTASTFALWRGLLRSATACRRLDAGRPRRRQRVAACSRPRFLVAGNCRLGPPRRRGSDSAFREALARAANRPMVQTARSVAAPGHAARPRRGELGDAQVGGRPAGALRNSSIAPCGSPLRDQRLALEDRAEIDM